MDVVDARLLEALQADGRASNTMLADTVGLSASACLRRVRRLEQIGLITGYRAVVDRAAVERGQTVFVEVRLSSQRSGVLEAFETAIEACPALRSCHLMAGDSDYLLQLDVFDVAHYEHIDRTHLAAMPGLDRLHTVFALRTVIEDRQIEVWEGTARWG